MNISTVTKSIITVTHCDDIIATLFDNVENCDIASRYFTIVAVDATRFVIFRERHNSFCDALEALHTFNLNEFASSDFAENERERFAEFDHENNIYHAEIDNT
jgi:hypothetical protein